MPESVERVLLKALAKERSDRYATVRDMTAAFQAATRPYPLQASDAAGQLGEAPWRHPAEREMPPIESPSAGQAPATSRRAGRRKWLLAGIPILLVTVCVCLAVLRQLSEGAGVEPPAPVTTVSDQVPGAAPLVELAREAAAREPDNPELRLRLAEALVEAGQPGLAALEFSKSGESTARAW